MGLTESAITHTRDLKIKKEGKAGDKAEGTIVEYAAHVKNEL